MKKCSRCKIIKSLSSFCKERTNKDGLSKYCRDCVSILNKKERSKPEYIYKGIKERSIELEREYCSKEDFLYWYTTSEKICTYCLIPEEFIFKLNIIGRNGYAIKKRLEIERLDNSKGYLIGNMALACPRCNETKGRLLTAKEMFQIGRMLRRKWSEELKQLTGGKYDFTESKDWEGSRPF